MDNNELLKELVASLLAERESDRKFKFLSRVLFASVIFLIIIMLVFLPVSKIDYSKEHTAIIEINGMISPGGPVSTGKIIPIFKKAIENDNCYGIILKINSPGGSAAQSKIIYDEINKAKATTNKKIFAVIEDMGASGGYYIAASGDKIFSNSSSIVGSIGVRIDSFNIQALMKKLGIESQTISSGADKTILDPFNELTEKHKIHLQTLLSEIHKEFISDIKSSRKDKIGDKNVFSGLFWTGSQAIKMGLVDEIASIYDVNELYFENRLMITYNKKSNILDNILDTMLNSLTQTNTSSLVY
tara:strand:- start:221 stop:1123 length:903 start_codon:yes stop_codon:yes gene_type:complete